MNMRIWLECKKCGQVSEHGTACKRGRTYVRRECNECRRTDPRESTYRTWRAMLARCTDPKCKEWRWYGGRGISVCDEWRDFDRFVADMGLRPFPTASIERLDNNAGYSPANCKWIERKLQAANQRSNRLLTYNGHTKHLSEWARQTGIERRVLGWRLKKGWPPEEVLGFEPHRRRGSCRKPGPHSQHGCSLGALDGEA